MNYLGHLALSLGLSPEHRLGNVLGDFFKGFPEDLPGAVKPGVIFHRQIDAYTDFHPVVKKAQGRIPEPHKKFSGLMVDMYFDHFLAVHWDHYAPRSLEVSVQDFYRELKSLQPLWPEAFHRVYPWLIKDNWLVSYRDLEKLENSFRGLGKRLRIPNHLEEGLAPLREGYQEFQQDFFSFMAALVPWGRSVFSS